MKKRPSVSKIAADFLKTHLDATGAQLTRVESVDTRRRSFQLGVSAVENYLAELEETGERQARYDIPEQADEERTVKAILQSATKPGKFYYGTKRGIVLWVYCKRLAQAVDIGADLDALIKSLAEKGHETIAEWT